MSKKATARIIGELRKNAHMTQSELARKIGKGTSTLQKYELGLLEPNIETLTKLSDIFDVSIDYLLGAVPENTLPEVFKRLQQLLGNDYRVGYEYLGEGRGVGCPAMMFYGDEERGVFIDIFDINEYGDLDETAKDLKIDVQGFSDNDYEKLYEAFPTFENEEVIDGFKSIKDFVDSLVIVEEIANYYRYPKLRYPKETLYDPSLTLETYLQLLSREQKEVLLGAAKVMVQQNTVKDKE